MLIVYWIGGGGGGLAAALARAIKRESLSAGLGLGIACRARSRFLARTLAHCLPLSHSPSEILRASPS